MLLGDSELFCPRIVVAGMTEFLRNWRGDQHKDSYMQHFVLEVQKGAQSNVEAIDCGLVTNCFVTATVAGRQWRLQTEYQASPSVIMPNAET